MLYNIDMYQIDRLWDLRNSSPLNSPEYILAGYFLDPENLNSKNTLTSIQEATFISKSAVHRFCRDGGFSSLRSFQTALTTEFTELRIRLQDKNTVHSYGTDYTDYFSSESIKEKINELTAILTSAENIYLYGRMSNISTLYLRNDIFTLLRKSFISLCGWSMESVRKKLSMCTEKDCLIVIDSDFNLSNLEIRLEIEEGVLKYSELASQTARKVFIGKEGGSADKRFTVFPLPSLKTGSESMMVLALLHEIVCERMVSNEYSDSGSLSSD